MNIYQTIIDGPPKLASGRHRTWLIGIKHEQMLYLVLVLWGGTQVSGPLCHGIIIQAEIHHAELINPNFVNTCGTVAFLLQIKIMASSWIGNSSYEPGKCSVKSASTGNRAISANCKFLIHLPKTPFMQIFQTHPSLLGGVRFSAADTFPGMNRSYNLRNGAWIEKLTQQFYSVCFRRIASWWKIKRKLLFY